MGVRLVGVGPGVGRGVVPSVVGQGVGANDAAKEGEEGEPDVGRHSRHLLEHPDGAKGRHGEGVSKHATPANYEPNNASRNNDQKEVKSKT